MSENSEHYEKYKELIKTSNQKWRERKVLEDPEYFKDLARNWRATNREKHRAYMRQYMKRYWREHPDKARAHSDWVAEYQKGKRNVQTEQ